MKNLARQEKKRREDLGWHMKTVIATAHFNDKKTIDQEQVMEIKWICAQLV